MADRDPRRHDNRYLGFVAGLPCVACVGQDGRITRPVQVAHLRAGSLEFGKRPTGLAEKPHDRPWTLPLCPNHHVNGPKAQHNFPGGELSFWQALGINPFALCLALSDAYSEGRAGYAVIAKYGAAGRKARGAA